jgi:hypothetical protein
MGAENLLKQVVAINETERRVRRLVVFVLSISSLLKSEQLHKSDYKSSASLSGIGTIL